MAGELADCEQFDRWQRIFSNPQDCRDASSQTTNAGLLFSALVQGGAPDARERNSGRPIRGTHRFGIDGLELANHAQTIDREIAAHPASSVRFETWVET